MCASQTYRKMWAKKAVLSRGILFIGGCCVRMWSAVDIAKVCRLFEVLLVLMFLLYVQLVCGCGTCMFKSKLYINAFENIH